MDSDCEGRNCDGLDHPIRWDRPQNRGSNATKTNQGESDSHEEFHKKRYPISRSGNNPGRVKRVVSCKRKTHHLTVVRRKPHASGRTSEAANKENNVTVLQDAQQGKMLHWDSLERSQNISNNHETSLTGSEPADYKIFTELMRDHKTMVDILFGRHLRLKVAFTLWQRNVEELLTYFLKIQDIAVVVDFLPIFSKCIDEDSPKITIGSCVDLFPLVRKVLNTKYEEYLVVGLKWIHSVVRKWKKELQTSGYSGTIQPHLDVNFQVFNQQLWELWQEKPSWESVPEATANTIKFVESFLFQLNQQH
ncbi:KATNB1-like protein 1 [Oryzias melastigma]|uniref:KATNB1-like protein 1 n=1 Tax=Oryzias melastigma TaxID=30732 RepID=A0A834CLM2_ORYME|nr:KATNB1-like protein 1 [Oryzias melastigma]